MPALHPVTSLPTDKILIAPSLLSADYACLAEEVKDVATSDMLHLDIMDGHFVPNMSFGPALIKGLRAHSDLVFDVHLMISHPRKYLDPFIAAGSDHITIHVESSDDIGATLREIRSAGLSAGITLRPGTPACSLYPYLDLVDMILVMTVEPGFGGQSFMAGQMPKVRTLKDAIERSGKKIHLQVDGGIAVGTAAQARAAGANVYVAGSSVFNAKNMTRAEAIAALRKDA